MSATAEPLGTLEVALAHAARLLANQPELAAEQAREVLKVAPGHPLAQLLLGVAQRLRGDALAALGILEPLARSRPDWAAAHYELGVALGFAERPEDAISALRRALALKPDMPDAWRALGDQLTVLADTAGADAAYAQHIRSSTQDPRLLTAAAALCENRIPEAEALLRAHLKKFATDVAALRMLAEVAARLRRFQDAESLLERCLELAPSFTAARHNYAVVLHRQNKPAAALRELQTLLAAEPRHPGYQNLKAAVLARIGEYEQSIELYEDVLAAQPQQPRIWMSYGHALKTKGRESASIAAYEKSIGLLPSLGEAYWSLANLKTVRFTPAQIDAMSTQLERSELAAEDRLHLHFAMGKALEDAGAYGESFAHYDQGNRLRHAAIRYSPEEMTEHVRRSKSLFSAQFLAARARWGEPSPDPIFIVGLPRAGSTLLEQILSSHSQVEGTMELPDIPAIAKALAASAEKTGTARYPERLVELDPSGCRALGEQYLQRTRIQRKSGKPFFIDKMPNNFAHIPLILLALPNARIIDARRHPLGCCFSGFKQHFARGQLFTYSQEDLGRYYRDYVELMAHFDRVLPGRIHRVHYEALIEDTEAEVRRLLQYCALPFEPDCLRFYENDRSVRTASSQQVRQPLFRAGLDHWRNYAPWLGPMKTALGPVLERYPQAPEL
ncbi:MAG TPA: sulfotransferase [Steroidobacteraceae bacterium]